jgi:hypothetical protein
MPILRAASALLALQVAAAAQAPLPELKVEATDGGSALRVRNTASQPLTAFFIELVGYPGSSFAFYQEGIGKRIIAPRSEERIAITNMTVGASPEYVQMQAALYADGTSAGPQEKVAQLIGLRRTTLETTRGLIAQLQKGRDSDKAALVDALRQWAGSIAEPSKRERGSPAAVTRSTQRDLIYGAVARLEDGSVQDVLAALTASERALALSKPAL